MKIDTKQESALVIGGQATTMGLNNLDPSVFVQMLISLYQFPIEASVREALSNSWDSVVAAGSTTPPVVGLTKDKFFVQDFGTGMSPEFMLSSAEGFSTIGYSTKRDRDDQLGYWGFGKVVALSYSRDQFWIHTVWESKAYEYLVFLDGNTIKVLPIKEEDTTEPNGTRVVVQLKKEWREFDKWKQAIEQQCAYFEGTVIDIEGEKKVVEVEKKGFVWKSNLYQGESHLILGSVYYDIPWNKFPEWEIIAELELGIHFDLTEGITPVPSREAWEFNETSKELLVSKFKIILEDIWEQCEKELKEIKGKSRIERLSFFYKPFLSMCSYVQYKNICTLLNKSVIEIQVDTRFKGNERSVWTGLRDSFKGSGVYCERWTPLKREYARSLGLSCAERTKVKFDLYWMITIPNTDRETRLRVADQIKEELLNEWIDHHYTKFDEAGFLEWKKNRETKKREINKGVIYYRESLRNPMECTQDKRDIDLSKFRYVFKATESTAKKYWLFLNKTFKNFIITKQFGYDMDNMEPSPLLKRMCSEALKTRVYNILGNRTNDKNIRKIIDEVNPLLGQYLDEVPLKEKSFSEEQQALIEAGEKFNCFDKDEFKLRYMEHHLKLLEFSKYVGYKDYTWSDLKLGENEVRLIKRHYLLERLAEKKWKEQSEVTVDTNQLELQLN